MHNHHDNHVLTIIMMISIMIVMITTILILMIIVIIVIMTILINDPHQGLLMMFAASIHACLSVAYMSPRYQDIVYGQVFDHDGDHDDDHDEVLKIPKQCSWTGL